MKTKLNDGTYIVVDVKNKFFDAFNPVTSEQFRSDMLNEMLDARTRESLKVLPVNKIKCDGYNLIIKNKVITTVTL